VQALKESLASPEMIQLVTNSVQWGVKEQQSGDVSLLFGLEDDNEDEHISMQINDVLLKLSQDEKAVNKLLS